MNQETQELIDNDQAERLNFIPEITDKELARERGFSFEGDPIPSDENLGSENDPESHLEENEDLGKDLENPSEEIEENPNDLRDKFGLKADSRIHEFSKDGTPREWWGKLKLKKGWEKDFEAVKADQGGGAIIEEEAQETQKEKTPDPPPLFDPEEEEKTEEEETKEWKPEEEENPNPATADNEMGASGVGMNELKNMTARQVGNLIASTFVIIGIQKVGSEFEPMVIDTKTGRTDKDEIADQWAEYLEGKDVIESLPKWMIPVLGMASYTATRAMNPKNEMIKRYLMGFVSRVTSRAKVTWLWIRAKFTGKKTSEVLRDDMEKKD